MNVTSLFRPAIALVFVVSCNGNNEKTEITARQPADVERISQCVADLSAKFLEREQKLNEAALDAVTQMEFDTAAKIQLRQRRLEEDHCMALATCVEKGPSYDAMYYWRCVSDKECDE